jgi:hypothetical protein
VAPKLYAASLWELGMALSISREIEVIIGMIIIARTIPAVKISKPNGAFAKKGRVPPNA